MCRPGLAREPGQSVGHAAVPRIQRGFDERPAAGNRFAIRAKTRQWDAAQTSHSPCAATVRAQSSSCFPKDGTL
jgi:hypothetical protein